MKQFQFGKFCTPAQLYLILASISLLTGFFNNFRVATLLVSGVLIVLWAWILNFLCRKGFSTISWVLVLLPIVLQLAGFFLAMDASEMKYTMNPVVNVTKEGMDPNPIV